VIYSISSKQTGIKETERILSCIYIMCAGMVEGFHYKGEGKPDGQFNGKRLVKDHSRNNNKKMTPGIANRYSRIARLLLGAANRRWVITCLQAPICSASIPALRYRP
jgi:hypothetical protein